MPFWRVGIVYDSGVGSLEEIVDDVVVHYQLETKRSSQNGILNSERIET